MEIKSTNLYKWLKQNQFVYFAKYRLTDKDYLEKKRKMKESTSKSKQQIEAEMLLCKEYWGCDAAHYVRYELFDKQLSKEELLDYIPPYYFYNYYMPAAYSGVDIATYSNKLNLFGLFSKKGIPTPEVIAIVEKGVLKDLNARSMKTDLFCEMLKEEKKYFFKPVDGAGGSGIEVLININGGVKSLIESFLAKLAKRQTYIVQEGIVQRDDFMAVNASSVNTLRIVTQYDGSCPQISACVMRIGRNGKHVDNSHQGGMSCRIDLNDGSLNECATAEHGGGAFLEHPDSGFVFKGKSIEGWEEIKKAVLSYASCFPELKELGWDIAVTPEGVQVIEMNLGFGLDHLQVSCGGMRRKLNVYPGK